jgi:aldehyde oxidoreductase
MEDLNAMGDPITLTLNGQKRVASVDPGTSLLEVLRDVFGLTGTKQGCGSGGCGACTVLLDGRPVNSCLVLAVEADGHSVRTIEGLEGPGINPVQRAFLRHGAVQCGFCSPGAIMCAMGLLAENPSPSEADVRAALAGNLCRCTGYSKIIEAVLDASREWQAYKGGVLMLIEDAAPPSDGLVGARVGRLDGEAKVTGQAKYAADISLPGMLHARAVRSPHAHALIRGINCSSALAMPGVTAVLTADDLDGKNLFGSRDVMDQPVLATGKVRFLGEAVALVVAGTPRQAEQASAKVEVSYESLPGVFGPDEALAEGAPAIHEGGNLCYEGWVRRGDFDRACSEAHLVVSNTYSTPMVDHAFLEPHAAVAAPVPEGVTVWVTTKTIHPVQADIARILGLPKENVRVISATVGGSFGGKPDTPCAVMAALAAVKTGCPVKLVYDREETFQVSTKRHPCIIRSAYAVSKDGHLLGAQIDVLTEAGAYTGDSRATVARQIIHAVGPYLVAGVEVHGRAVFTNHPVTGAMRGYGVPQVAFAHESQMDIIASRLGLDPIEIRLRNILRSGQTTVTGQVVPEGVGAEACLLRLRELLSQEAGDDADKDHPVGCGVACFYYGNGRTAIKDVGRCRLRYEPGGTFTLFVGVPDVGQGSTTILSQIACKELGIPWGSLKIVTADTDSTPETGPASATRVTVVVGRAVQAACRQIRETLQSSGGTSSLEETGEFQTDSTPLDDNGQGRPYETYTFGAQAVKLRLDRATGKAAVERLIAVYDVGPVINPLLFEGQVEGGALCGIGYALYEDTLLDEGRVTNPNFHTYLVPTAMDAPRVTSATVVSSDGAGPFGAKGIGEPAIIPTAPAVINAIAQASGARFLSIPVTLERLYRAISGSSSPDPSGRGGRHGATCDGQLERG